MFLYALKIYIKYSLNQMFDISFKQPILFSFYRSIEIHQYLNQSILTIVVIYLVYSIIVIEFNPIQIVSYRCVSLWLPAERATCEWLTAEFKLALIHTCRGEFKSCTGVLAGVWRECDLYGIGSQPMGKRWRLKDALWPQREKPDENMTQMGYAQPIENAKDWMMQLRPI